MSLVEPFLPPHMHDGMKNYLEHGIEPGSFLMSVLCNDLKGAFMRADHINQEYIAEIVSYCMSEVPSIAWGSPERVHIWMHGFKTEEVKA